MHRLYSYGRFRTASGHARHADPRHTAAWVVTRLWHRPPNPAAVGGCAEGGRGVTVPGAAAAVAERLGDGGMEAQRDQAPRPFLSAHRRRTEATGYRSVGIRAHGGRHRPRFAPRIGD